MEIKKILVNNQIVDFCTDINPEEIEENDFFSINDTTIDLSNTINTITNISRDDE